MQANSFNNWKEHPVTKALMDFLQEEIEGIIAPMPDMRDAQNPLELASKIGYVSAFRRILNIDREDLREDES